MKQVMLIVVVLLSGLIADWPFAGGSAIVLAMRPSASRRDAAGRIDATMLDGTLAECSKSEGVSMTNCADLTVSRIAAAIGETARIRMLYSLMNGGARTSTELAAVAGVSGSTASAHLSQLRGAHLVKVFPRGKYRYYCLEEPGVADALEALSVLAGGVVGDFAPKTPSHLRDARTCYDHMAGRLGVLLHNRFQALGWLSEGRENGKHAYDLTSEGAAAFEALGIDLRTTRSLRRRFAYACLDWSERQPHIGGALGAALLKTALKRKWVIQELDGRALTVTKLGRGELQRRFGVCSEIRHRLS
jgi:DNA-binding transcriptional ArsR family regulator